MSIFQNVTLAYKGQSVVVSANSVLPLIAQIEEVITLGDVIKPNPPLGKLAMAYGVALRYAGLNVTDEALYAEMFAAGAKGAAAAAVSGLLSMMIPPSQVQVNAKAKADKTANKKKVKATRKNS